MIVLGFDTAAAHCAGAIWHDGQVIGARRDPMARGQAERLMVLLEELLNEQDLTWNDLNAIGVGVGPGNFTGIRISVSAARGLALGLGIPAIGIDRFDVIETLVQREGIPAVPATQNNLYIRENNTPRMIDAAQAKTLSQEVIVEPIGLNPAIAIATLAAQRADSAQPRPAPLYIKSADAAPARDAPPRIIP